MIHKFLLPPNPPPIRKNASENLVQQNSFGLHEVGWVILLLKTTFTIVIFNFYHWWSWSAEVAFPPFLTKISFSDLPSPESIEFWDNIQIRKDLLNSSNYFWYFHS